MINPHEYRLIAAGGLLLVMFLGIFWYHLLRRLAEIIRQRLVSTHSHQSFSGFAGIFLFLFRAEFERTGDPQLIAICKRLRQLLYGYFGIIGAYIVFLIICRPRF